MRRILALTAVPVAAVLALAGCGSAPANAQVSASGSFGKAPSVTIPKQTASSSLTVKTPIKGNGATIGKSDSFLSNFNLYVWNGKTHKLLDSTYPSNPEVLPAKLLPGVQSAVVGKKVGSRVVAVVPPKEGYGKSGNPQLGVTGKDTLVFVMDLMGKYPGTASASGTQVSNGGGNLPKVSGAHGTAPTVTVPKTTPPKSLVAKPLIKGTGAKVSAGQTVIAQYTAVNWRTGQAFDASWTRKIPFSFKVGASPSQFLPGVDKGLVGQTVGSRVMLVIPPADGFGSQGQPQAGIKGTDTLVLVIDILGAVRPAS